MRSRARRRCARSASSSGVTPPTVPGSLVPGDAAATVSGPSSRPSSEGDPMLLVPRQLQRAGMTGKVPYYGGRLTPGQIQGLTRPPAPPGQAVPLTREQADALRALDYLRDTGVLDQDEHAAY